VIPRLCYMTDGERGTAGRSQAAVIAAAFRGGAGMVVVRERHWEVSDWRALLAALAAERVRGLRLLASRRLDLVRALGLDGVHLGSDAVSVREARAWLGPATWIGYSAHSREEAAAAARDGADYATLSPIFATRSKPGDPGRGCAWLAEALRGLTIPALALGGIEPARVGEVCAAGAWGVAAVSALGAAPDPERSAREFCTVLARNPSGSARSGPQEDR
jgi:thiamine-phosphate pyrophosphorylase